MPSPSTPPMTLTGAQKAAIIVRLISSQGGAIPLANLSAPAQRRLTQQFQGMGKIDTATVRSVILDFANELSDPSLNFPDTLMSTLQMIEEDLSPEVANDLRRAAGLSLKGDPWPAILGMPVDALAKILQSEGLHIGAIIVSKLDPEKASEVLAELPEDMAQEMAYAMEATKSVQPDVVASIGAALANDAAPSGPKAFDAPPVARVADILNAAGSAQRDTMLEALEKLDAAFAAEVREAIFTFADIPTRIEPTDVPKFVRLVDGEAMVTALAAAQPELGKAVEFILANMSQRMADQLREEMSELGSVATKPGEQAMGQVTAAIRKLKEDGEITFVKPSEDEEET